MLSGMALAILTYRPIYEQMYQLTNVQNKQEIVDQKEEYFEEINTSDGKDEIITRKSHYTDGSILTTIDTKHITTNDSPTSSSKTFITIAKGNYFKLVLLIFIQIIYITLVYGPIAAFLVEIFPVKIRYTSMSLPYHIGNGVFGGLLPAVSTYLATNAQSLHDPSFYLAGLWYPIIISAVCFIIGALYINKNIYTKN